MRGEYLLKKTISLKSESLRDIRTITGSALLGSLTLVIEDLLFKGLKSLNFFVKF